MEQARGIEWHKDPERALDFDNPPFARWFVGGETNLCYNAVDRHLPERGEQNALIYISTETGERKSYIYRELHREVNAFASALKSLGVGRGDRVIVYMPMVPEAIFAMLACARLGAIHSVVFGGFSAPNLAKRIDDAKPKVVVAADAGVRGGSAIYYKPIIDDALESTEFPPERLVLLNRGIAEDLSLTEGRDLDYAELREHHSGEEVPVQWVESSEPSYILYTSGTTGTPKGVQRDTGGHAVALEASMRHIFQGEPGETMFTAPTAIRALRGSDPKYIEGRNLGRTLRNLFLAGEPLDAPTSEWASKSLGSHGAGQLLADGDGVADPEHAFTRTRGRAA